jgi:phosphate transport system protein
MPGDLQPARIMNDEPPAIEGHTSRAFDGELASLHLHVVQMGGLVLKQVHDAAHAYAEWQPEAAQDVVQNEPQVNAYERTIDAEQFNLIARRAPVAGDLRVILAMSKCTAELERAGDEAKKIAAAVLRQARRPGAATTSDARHMGKLAHSLLRLSLESLDRIDAEAAAQVIARDAELDAEYGTGLRRLLQRAVDEPQQFDLALEGAFVLKSLERIGDHARNLARQVRGIVNAAAARGAQQA